MRHPETAGVALIPASSLVLHQHKGWLRVSDAIAEETMHGVDLAAYAEAADLDAADTDAEPAAKPQAKTKETK